MHAKWNEKNSAGMIDGIQGINFSIKFFKRLSPAKYFSQCDSPDFCRMIFNGNRDLILCRTVSFRRRLPEPAAIPIIAINPFGIERFHDPLFGPDNPKPSYCGAWHRGQNLALSGTSSPQYLQDIISYSI